MSKQPPPASTVSAVGPCRTVIQIVGRPGTGSLLSTIAPSHHPTTTFQRKMTSEELSYCPLKQPNKHLEKHANIQYVLNFTKTCSRSLVSATV